MRGGQHADRQPALCVRPLLWREKVILARFAHLGPTFIQHHFLRLSLVGKLPPASETTVAALNALALWVNAPDESQPGVPLDPELLGTVALKVCRAAGLRPADLDERSAAEVELIWHAISHSEEPSLPTSRPTEDDDGQVRIIVIPDPSPEELASVTKSGHNLPSQDSVPRAPSESAEAFEDVTQRATSMGLSGEAVATPSPDQSPESGGKPEIAAIREDSTSIDSTVSSLLATPISPATPILAKSNSETFSEKPLPGAKAANTFRIFYPTTIIQDKPDENLEPMASPATQQHRKSLSFPIQDSRASPGTPPMPVHSTSRTQRNIKASAPNGMPAATPAMASLPQPGQASQQEGSPPIEWGIWLDELNDQLEQAADDLGIDLEG